MRGSRPKAQWYGETAEEGGGVGVGKFAVVFEVKWARLLCSCSPTTELNILFQYSTLFSLLCSFLRMQCRPSLASEGS